ncbi:hypothetical protein RN001_002442 [Aquatica leii]|uniref:Uncharacterized protein n=1 Tax=Aquatica leii TaxID=1421715 RepID=A0AAN7SDA3_9COLE|nr:hypothetical protein RN001_002442 [Aquatica leii]
MNAFTGEEFCDWKNSKPRIEAHKNSDFHKTNVRVKSLSQTRWSARHDACYALEKEWSAIIDALEFIAESRDKKPTTRSEATELQRKLQHLETAVVVIVWNVILDHCVIVYPFRHCNTIEIYKLVLLYSPHSLCNKLWLI